MPGTTILTERGYEKVSSGIATILDIKLKTVRKHEASEDECSDQCVICSEDLFGQRRRPRSRTLRVTKRRKPSPAAALQVARLLPCGHLFHRKCINEWIICEKEVDNFAPEEADEENANRDVDEDVDEDVGDDLDEDLATDIAMHESMIFPETTGFVDDRDMPIDEEADDEDADENIEWIELPNGWRSADGLHFAAKPTGVICKCPTCRADILPADEDFDYTLKWTAKERDIVRSFFPDKPEKNSVDKSQNWGESTRFAKDLMAGRRDAQKWIREGCELTGPAFWKQHSLNVQQTSADGQGLKQKPEKTQVRTVRPPNQMTTREDCIGCTLCDEGCVKHQFGSGKGS